MDFRVSGLEKGGHCCNRTVNENDQQPFTMVTMAKERYWTGISIIAITPDSVSRGSAAVMLQYCGEGGEGGGGCEGEGMEGKHYPLG